MNTRRLVVGIIFLAVFAMAARISMDTDSWWHLRAGQWIAAHGTVPQVDPFSYTRLGAAWQYPGWLVELPMLAIYQALGPGGLNLWTAAMVTLAFAFIWPTLSGGPLLRAFTIIFAATVSAVYWAARPYLVSFVLAAVYLWILEDFRWERAGFKRLFCLPALMVLWVNSHGGFAVGFILWGVYFIGCLERVNVPGLLNLKLAYFRQDEQGRALVEAWKYLAAVGLLMALAVCLNPSGAVMLLYPFKTVSIGALQNYIQEWQSPNFHSLQVQPFAWFLLLTFGVVGVSRRRLLLTDFLLVSGFAYLGLMAGRNVALFALVTPQVFTRHAEPFLLAWGRLLGIRLSLFSDRPVSRTQARLNWLILLLLGVAVLLKLALVFPVKANEKIFTQNLPVKAVEFIRHEQPPGRLFNSYNWGGYLLWALPEYPVFVDGRTDLYDDQVLNEWLQVVRAEPGWQAVLDRYAVKTILLEPGQPVVARMETEGWRQVYKDDVAVIYVR